MSNLARLFPQGFASLAAWVPVATKIDLRAPSKKAKKWKVIYLFISEIRVAASWVLVMI